LFSLLLRRDVAAFLLCDLFFGTEPVFQIAAVLPPALLVQFVGAAANLILYIGNRIFVLLD
jgi:hypothetical protein